MQRNFNLFKYFAILIFLVQNIILASTTGKIAGKVREKGTNEPIIGANIIIEGTTMGAASDVEGNFIINNVPPGMYNLIFSAIGYQKVVIQNVRVNIDFTTRIDVEMVQEAIVTELIVVQAQAPMVRKDQTSSRATVDASQISALPVESLTQILTLQAGITQGAGGELHIRGGRSTEIAYTINGISISNPFDNSRAVEISANAIEELSVVSGTFNAEYGGALSGIVNTVTKEGGEKYRGSISLYSGDYISRHKDVFFNIDEINPGNNIVGEFTLGGPIPFLEKNISFFASSRYNYDQGFLYGIRRHLPKDSMYRNPNNPNDLRISMSGDNKIVSMNPSLDLNSTLKLTFKIFQGFKLNYDLIYSNSEYKNYNHDYKYNPEANYTNYEWGLVNAIEIRHAISGNTFYSLKGSYNINDYKRYLYPLVDINGKEITFYPGKSWEGVFPNLKYQPEHKRNRPANYTFAVGGTQNFHFYQRTNTISGKFDITSQVTNQHELKSGIEFRNHEIAYENFEILRDTTTYKQPYIPPKNSTKHDYYIKKPIEFSAYIQDKMEFESMVINLGIRYDYFNSNANYSTNTTYPSPNYPNLPANIDKNSLLAKAPAKHQFSPRFGISFPVTDKAIIHFSYGHFYQMPPFRYLYTNADFKYDFSVGTPTFGNANLNPEKTVSYEIGWQQQFAENLAMNATAFFKDVRDLLALQKIRVSSSETYLKYVNQDYGNIKGFTISLTKRRTAADWLGATLDYTYQVAEGNDVNSDAFFLDISSGRQAEKVPVFLDWDQTHTLNGSINIGKMNSWNVTLVGKLGTGLPYTPSLMDQQYYLKTNSDRKPTRLTVDMLADKTFALGSIDLTIFLRIYNLFDAKNERYVYNDTGRANYSLEQKRFGGPTDELAQRIPGIQPTSEYFNRPNYYYPPREVRIGVSLDF